MPRAASRSPHGCTSSAARPPLPVILISTHAEEDYADLIASSSVVGFLPKVDLSADAIRDLLRTP